MDPFLLGIGFSVGIILIAMIIMWVVPFFKRDKKEDEPVVLEQQRNPLYDAVEEVNKLVTVPAVPKKKKAKNKRKRNKANPF